MPDLARSTSWYWWSRWTSTARCCAATAPSQPEPSGPSMTARRPQISIVLVTARSPAETIPVAAATGRRGHLLPRRGRLRPRRRHRAPHPTTVPVRRRSTRQRVRTVAPTAAFGWVDPAGAGREPTYQHRRTLPGPIGPIDQHLTDGVWHLFIRDANRQPLPADRIRAEIGDLAESLTTTTIHN
jgi:hypothetical protein